jgi:hypothetical protein
VPPYRSKSGVEGMSKMQLWRTLLTLVIFILPSSYSFSEALDSETGLIIDPGYAHIKAHCIACHSPKLVVQNRMSWETWLETIRWMQKKQGLWPLGAAEKPILDYLAKNYGPLYSGRRKPIPPELMPKR